MKRKYKALSFDLFFQQEELENFNYLMIQFFGNTESESFYFDKNLETETLEIESKINEANKTLQNNGIKHSIKLFTDKTLKSFVKAFKYQFPFVNIKDIPKRFSNNLIQLLGLENFDRGIVIREYKHIQAIEIIEEDFDNFISGFYIEHLLDQIRYRQEELDSYARNHSFQLSEDFEDDEFLKFYHIPYNETEEEKQIRISNQILEETEWDIANRLDKRTAEKIANIQKELFDLKQNANFYVIASFLYKIIGQNHDITPLSRLVITQNFELLLPDYNNTKIHLSHLTKAIYILFLKYPEGIAKQDYKNHRTELLEIYKSISYQNSYEKMQNSVNKLFEKDSKEFAVHFSRIRSAFEKKFTHLLAHYYIVDFSLGTKRKIKLDRNLVIWETEI